MEEQENQKKRVWRSQNWRIWAYTTLIVVYIGVYFLLGNWSNQNGRGLDVVFVGAWIVLSFMSPDTVPREISKVLVSREKIGEALSGLDLDGQKILCYERGAEMELGLLTRGPRGIVVSARICDENSVLALRWLIRSQLRKTSIGPGFPTLFAIASLGVAAMGALFVLTTWFHLLGILFWIILAIAVVLIARRVLHKTQCAVDKKITLTPEDFAAAEEALRNQLHAAREFRVFGIDPPAARHILDRMKRLGINCSGSSKEGVKNA